MYCDLWPYVLWPLDFQIQKRIVSAETIWGNTVCTNSFVAWIPISYLWKKYRRSPHFVISEFVIPAISWFGFRHYFVKIPDILWFKKKSKKKILFWDFFRKISYFPKEIHPSWFIFKLQFCEFLTISYFQLPKLFFFAFFNNFFNYVSHSFSAFFWFPIVERGLQITKNLLAYCNIIKLLHLLFLGQQ